MTTRAPLVRRRKWEQWSAASPAQPVAGRQPGSAGGAGAGAAAGLAGVLLTRGPDVVLQKGSVVEMVLDRTLHYDEKELEFTPARSVRPHEFIVPANDDSRTQKRSIWPFPF